MTINSYTAAGEKPRCRKSAGWDAFVLKESDGWLDFILEYMEESRAADLDASEPTELEDGLCIEDI